MLYISQTNQIYSDKFQSEFSYIEIWLTDQNSVLLELEDTISFTPVINDKVI